MKNKLFNVRISTLLLALILASISVNAQDESPLDLNTVYPPTPNVAALIGYSETQVELSAGLPSISIPLYNIKQGNIQVPISLNYSTGGIRVEEVASWVGLGWSLSCGGVISRTMQGLPDDYSPRGYMHTSYTMEDLMDRRDDGESIHQDIVEAMENRRDYEPDIFHISCPGFSGKFFWDQQNQEFVQMPRSNAKIQKIGSDGIDGWVVTSDNGTKYYFGQNESGSNVSGQEYIKDPYNLYYDGTLNESEGAGLPDYIGSWHLMEIVDVNNKRITFSYAVNRNVEQVMRTGESEVYPACKVGGHHNISFTSREFDEKIPSEIIFDKGKVVFYPSETTRLDLNNSRALGRIEIQYPDGSLFKSFNLVHGYFTSSDIGTTANLVSASDVAHKRLYLDKLYEADKNGFRQNPYEFDYNDKMLPDRFSKDQDIWGFYNDKDNTSLLPYVEMQTSLGSMTMGDADRSVNPDVSQACNLEKITYPTGGREEFIYEQNEYKVIGTEISWAQEYLVSQFTELKNAAGAFVKNSVNWRTDELYEKEFTIPEGIFSKFNFEIEENTGCTGIEDPTDDCAYNIIIEGISNDFNSGHLFGTRGYYLEPGDYKFVAIENEKIDESTFVVYFNFKYVEDNNGDYPTGGLRIKEIITRDNKGNEQIKTYEYENGNLLNIPVNIYDSYFNGICDPSVNGFKLVSGSMDASCSHKGSNVGYQKVTKYFDNDGVGGRTVYLYNILPKEKYTLSDQYVNVWVNAGSELPVWKHNDENTNSYMAPFFFDYWKQGSLDYVFNYPNNSNSNISLDRYYWDSFSETNPIFENVGVKIQPTISGVNGDGDAAPPTFLLCFYSYSTEWYRSDQKIETLHYDDNIIRNTVTYNYDNNPIIVSSEETKNSREEDLTTKYYYPSDFGLLPDIGGADRTALLKMKNLNMINTPVQIEKYIDDGLIEKKRILYKDFVDIGIIKPYKVLTSYGSSEDFTSEIEFVEYDEKGNPNYSILRNGDKNCYLWSYNYTFPVTFIKGISYDEIETLFGGAVNVKTLAENTSTSSIAATLNGLRSSLSANKNVQIITALYDPLKGAVNVTDPNGLTTEYTYDNFGRLSLIRDNDENIINKYNYHFAGQPIAGFTIENVNTDVVELRNSGNRKITLEVTVKNADSFGQTCHIVCTLEGKPPVYFEQEIAANGTATFNTSWMFGPGSGTTKQITISRDALKNLPVYLPSTSPANMNFESFSLSGDISGGDVTAIAEYSNTGGVQGESSPMCYVYKYLLSGMAEPEYEGPSADWELVDNEDITVIVDKNDTNSGDIDFHNLPNDYYAFVLKEDGNILGEVQYADVNLNGPPPPSETFNIEIESEDDESLILECILTTGNTYSAPNVELETHDSSGSAAEDDSEIITPNPGALVLYTDGKYKIQFTINKPPDDGTYYLRAILYDGTTYLGKYADIEYSVPYDDD